MANTNCFLPYPLQGEIHYLFSWDTSSESFEFYTATAQCVIQN